MIDICSYKNEYKKMMNEILCERPYAMYSFLMNLEKDPYYLRKAYHRIEASDIEEFLRCGGKHVEKVIGLLNNRQERLKFKAKYSHFNEIKNEIKHIVKRIQKCPYYDSFN